MTDRRDTIRAVFLAAIMVVSVLAIGTASVGAAGPSEEFAQNPTDVSDVQSTVESQSEAVTASESVAAEEVDIDENLEGASGEVRALVYLTPAEVSPEMAPETVQETLQAQAEATQPETVETLEELGVSVSNDFWIVNALSVTYDADEVDVHDLAAVESVVAVMENHEIERPEPLEGSAEEPTIVGDVTYGIDQINADTFWDEFGTQGEDAIIVIQDNGFDVDHEALDFEEAHMLDGDGNKIGDPAVEDHGTHVAGTAAGGEDPDGVSIGVAGCRVARARHLHAG